jgi:hypothetical protein
MIFGVVPSLDVCCDACQMQSVILKDLCIVIKFYLILRKAALETYELCKTVLILIPWDEQRLFSDFLNSNSILRL